MASATPVRCVRLIYYTPTWVAPLGTVTPPVARPPALHRSTSRRMSFIGSADRTSGTTSKLFSGGGDVVNHSSVFAIHGSGPAITPTLRLRATFTIVTITPLARMKEPIVEIAL